MNKLFLKLIALTCISFFVAACSSAPKQEEALSRQTASKGGNQMVKGIGVAYVHTPNKKLADWYEKTLGLKKGYGDDTWQEFEMQNGSRFALDFVSYPSSTVQKQSIMLSFEVEDIQKAVDELAKKGVRFYPDNDKTKTIFDVGPSLIATFEDPDGNFVQISQSKKSW